MTEPKDIKAFAFDIDGVFTNGGVLCDINGELLRTYDAKDCFAVRMATMMGFPIAIITGGSSTSINVRFSTLGLNKEDVYMKSRIKTEDLQDFCTRHGLSAADVMFIGDDIPDVGPLMMAGLALCPADAVPEVKAVCDIVSDYPGGKGCIRNAVEMVLKAQGKWTFDAAIYKKLFG